MRIGCQLYLYNIIDNRGYTVSKVVGLGKLDIKTFFDECDEYIDNPSFLCADGNLVYKQYAHMMDYPLYIRPSNYYSTYRDATKDAKSDKEREAILKKLYENHEMDYIFGQEHRKYEEFTKTKQVNGLSLGRVNEFHSFIKGNLVSRTRGVTTKFLRDYVGAWTYMRNWRIDNGSEPTTREDAEKILVELLKAKVTLTVDDIRETDWKIKKSSSKYMAVLRAKTLEARKITQNEFFKFDEEDGVITFDKRHFLKALPLYRIKELKRKLGVPMKYNTTISIEELLKKPNLDEEIIQLIDIYKVEKITDEDMDLLDAIDYVIEHGLSKKTP